MGSVFVQYELLDLYLFCIFFRDLIQTQFTISFKGKFILNFNNYKTTPSIRHFRAFPYPFCLLAPLLLENFKAAFWAAFLVRISTFADRT
jgi:hypothetical protein